MKKTTWRGSLLALGLVGALAPAVAAADNVELTMWVNGWPQKAIDAIQGVANDFAAQDPDVKSVTVLPVPQSQHIQKLSIAVVGDSAPDVIALTAPFIQYTVKGLLQPLDPFIKAGGTVRREDYPPLVLDAFSAGGHLYGIPNIEASLGLVLAYNKRLFADAGYPTDRGPQSLAELQAYHRKLTRTDAASGKITQVGISPLDSMGGTYFPTIWSAVFDAKWYDAATHKLNMPAFTDAVDYIAQIYEQPGYDAITGAGIGGWTGGLASGKLAMQINGSWVPGELKSLNSDVEIGYTWMPTSIGDKATASLPWGTGIPVNAKHPQLSFRLIQYFASPEAAQRMFSAVGWLNGNLAAMRRLDVSSLPIVAQLIGMFDQADRLYAPPPVPIMDDIRYTIGSSLQPVWHKEKTAAAVLADVQRQMQPKLDQAFAEAKDSAK